MVNNFVLNDYFEWLYFKVVGNDSYRKLLSLLHSMDFRYSVNFDENRAMDGINLRWYYVEDGGQDEILRKKK